jgi:hypothetical protein
VRSVDGVDRIRTRRTPPPADAPLVQAAASTTGGYVEPATPRELRGIPAIGPGVTGAIKGTTPGANLR